MADLLQRDDKEKSQNAEWETEQTLGALPEMGNQQRRNLTLILGIFVDSKEHYSTGSWSQTQPIDICGY